MPPYADPAMRRYPVGGPSQRRPNPSSQAPSSKRRDPTWAKACLILGAIVMIVSGTVVVLPRVLASWATSDIPQEDLLPDSLRGANIDGAINVLLLGMDQRNGNNTEPIRTDTMIIAHIPATHDHVFLVSLPRDAEVDIPDFPESNFKGWRTKINAAFAFGNLKNGLPDPSPEGRKRGVRLTAMTINNLVPGGLRFNAVAIINFEGFTNVMNVIGGVDMCVDERTTSVHYDRNNKYHTMIHDVSKRKVYEKGCRHMEGWEALDFARQRYNVTGGDYGRQKHQQQLLMAIFKKLFSKGTLTDPKKLLELQGSAGDLLTLDMGKTSVADWIFSLKAMNGDSVTMVKMNGGLPNPSGTGSNEVLTPPSMELLKAVHDDKVFDFLSMHPTWVAAEK
jgi:LCP family protein required for cell wall assembly